MENKKTDFYCRVCGLKQEKPEFFWGEDNKTPSYNICFCCGVEFGYEDDRLENIRKYRGRWLDLGGKWFESKKMPQNWNVKEQMKNIPKEYL